MSLEVLERHQIGRWARVHWIEPEMVEAWGRFLEENWEWEWWLTLTFRDEVGQALADALWRRWLRWLTLEMECQICPREGRYPRCHRGEGVAYTLCRYRPRGMANIGFVRFTELHRWRGDRGVPHYHALMLGVGEFERRRAWEKAFELMGRSMIEPYDPALGARFYCTKYIAKGGEVLFSPGLENLRRANEGWH